MATVSEVVCKVLQLDCEPVNLNYYSMLKLPEETNEENKIRIAIQVAALNLQAASKNEQPAAIEVVKKLLQQASVVLLNAEKKAAYDSQLRTQIPKRLNANATAPAVQEIPNQTVVSAKLDQQEKAEPMAAPIVVQHLDFLAEFLPSGDPHAEFSLRDYLGTAPVVPPMESAESRLADLDALRKRLTPSNVINASLATQSNSSHRDPQSNRGGISIQERIRRKRAMQNTILVGGLTILSICLVGFAVFQFLLKNKQVSEGDKKGRPGQEVRTVGTMDDNANIDRNINQMAERKSNRSEAAFELPSMSDRFGEGTQSFFGDQANDGMKMDGMKDEGMKNNSMEGMKPMDAKPMDAKPMGESKEMMEPGFDQAAWDNLVANIRKSLAMKDFDKFTSQINELFAVQTKNPKNVALRDSLDRTGQVFQFGSEAFDSAIASLASGVALETEKDIINFVERKGNELIFRVRGKNTTYDLTALPVDILLAVLNFGLDTKKAVDVASRGVFVKLYNPGQEYQQRGDELLKRAADLDSKFASLDDLSQEAYRSK